ncbi:hypothetical protein ABPG75_004243 [Micractinium tetrahymenae]
MAGLGIRPFQHLATAQALASEQPDAPGGLASGAGRAASRALSAGELSRASTDTAGLDLLVASRGQSLCSAPDDATEEEEELSRELTREILLEELGALTCGGGQEQPGSSRRSSQRASRKASAEAPFDAQLAAAGSEEGSADEAAAEELQNSLYDQVGGGVVMKSIVDAFYARVLGDEHLARFFDGVDMAKHRRKFLLFATYVMGGPDEYEHSSNPWPQLYAVHERLIKHAGLKEVHLDMIKAHFKASLQQMGVGPKQIDQALAIVESTRRVIFPLEPPAGQQGEQQQPQQQQARCPHSGATRQPSA